MGQDSKGKDRAITANGLDSARVRGSQRPRSSEERSWRQAAPAIAWRLAPVAGRGRCIDPQRVGGDGVRHDLACPEVAAAASVRSRLPPALAPAVATCELRHWPFRWVGQMFVPIVSWHTW